MSSSVVLGRVSDGSWPHLLLFECEGDMVFTMKVLLFEASGMQKEYKGTAFSADVADDKHHVIDHKQVMIGSWNGGDDCKSCAQFYILFHTFS